MLWGRRQQFRTLDALLADVRAGRSGVLVVRGEPGIGKTALLGYAADTAQDFHVAQADGVESEMELTYAALHQLCGRMLGRLGRLPGPQREALGVVFGLCPGSAPDRFLVGLAVLGLLSEAAAVQPLLCLVDDAQWLDRASARVLAFVARRLDAESVALIFATRDSGSAGDLAGLPGLVLEGLPEADARALLASVIPGRLDERVRDRIIAEAGGNPLALLELPHGVTTAELAGGFGLPGGGPLAGRIEQSFLYRITPLPEATRRLLLLAAAEPVGDPALLWRAAGGLGISDDAAAPAEADRLLTVNSRVTFRHPLVRSAVYQAAPAADRRLAHRAIAEATDPGTDPDHRAWHHAQAAPQPDEEIAAELERSATRAQGRGGFAAAAAFLERATMLTPDPARRGARALAAAQAKFDAASPERAHELLAAAEEVPLDELQRARAGMLRAQIAFAQGRGSDASQLMLAAAKRLEKLDAGLARQAYLEALGAAMFAGRLSGAAGVREVAAAARAAGSASSVQPPCALDLLLSGLVVRFTEGYRAGVGPLRRALHALVALLREDGLTGREGGIPCGASADLWDDEDWHELASRGVRLTRDAGALTSLPVALTYQAGLLVFAGEFATAAAQLDEADAIAAATGNAKPGCVSPLLAALRGNEARALEVIEACLQHATASGEGRSIGHAEYAAAVLYNSLGRYQEAVEAAHRACEYEDLGVFGWALAELVEAAARTGDREAAAAALERLTERTSASGSDWGLGVEACGRALLSDGQDAERGYREALDRLGRTRVRVPLARAHLLYGEWLRRGGRRVDAREQLRTAHEMFAAMGAGGFAERAGRELRATGEHVRRRAADSPVRLTARETQIARLAGDGLSNPEIAAQLFMSPRTVEYHLHKVFTKLAITSRNQLHTALASQPGGNPSPG
jgi:DNA-binding CsgD family transcriptional regulator/tetratricopeptide (TPR) repeat protein